MADNSNGPSNSDIKLSPGANHLIDSVVSRHEKNYGDSKLSTAHWQLTTIEIFPDMVKSLIKDIDLGELTKQLLEDLSKGDAGKPLDVEEVKEKAALSAKNRSLSTVYERDILAVVYTEAGYQVEIDSAGRLDDAVKPIAIFHQGIPSSGPENSVLATYGEDLTKKAKLGKLNKIIGRDDEIEQVNQTLCRRTKRNPALVGPAGVGKTAIVEGLAQRITDKQVPKQLFGKRVIQITPSVLVGGARMTGELEKRVRELIKEASDPDIILFIDEIHTIMGAGGIMGTTDIASLLKPALARGEIAVIAATTNDEYRRFIEQDKALERRFNPIYIDELDREVTFIVLETLSAEYAIRESLEIKDNVLDWMINFADIYMKNRHFPDKAIDLLEETAAYALIKGKKNIDIEDAEEIGQRKIGIPEALRDDIDQTLQKLDARLPLKKEDRERLIARLNITLRQFDLRYERPSAVILLVGPATDSCTVLSEQIAETLFGDEERVVKINFGRMISPHDISMLIGSPPGYVGFSERVPIHQISETPWCVLTCNNIDACSPQVLNVLTQALNNGYIVDARGKSIFLSDAVIILTANISMAKTKRPIGFSSKSIDLTKLMQRYIEKVLGKDLLEQVDLIVFEMETTERGTKEWLIQEFLPEISAHYQRYGIDLSWDESFVNWLCSYYQDHQSQQDWEKFMEERLVPGLLNYIGDSGDEKIQKLKIVFNDGQIELDDLL